MSDVARVLVPLWLAASCNPHTDALPAPACRNVLDCGEGEKCVQGHCAALGVLRGSVRLSPRAEPRRVEVAVYRYVDVGPSMVPKRGLAPVGRITLDAKAAESAYELAGLPQTDLVLLASAAGADAKAPARTPSGLCLSGWEGRRLIRVAGGEKPTRADITLARHAVPCD